MKLIETTKGHILAVKVPEGAYDFHIETHTYGLTITYCDKNNEYCEIDMPPGDWQIINTWSRLCVTELMTLDLSFAEFQDLMHANGMYLVNPLGAHPGWQARTEDAAYELYEYRNKWQKYQEATGEYLILFKPNK